MGMLTHSLGDVETCCFERLPVSCCFLDTLRETTVLYSHLCCTSPRQEQGYHWQFSSLFSFRKDIGMDGIHVYVHRHSSSVLHGSTFVLFGSKKSMLELCESWERWLFQFVLSFQKQINDDFFLSPPLSKVLLYPHHKSSQGQWKEMLAGNCHNGAWRGKESKSAWSPSSKILMSLSGQ